MIHPIDLKYYALALAERERKKQAALGTLPPTAASSPGSWIIPALFMGTAIAMIYFGSKGEKASNPVEPESEDLERENPTPPRGMNEIIAQLKNLLEPLKYECRGRCTHYAEVVGEIFKKSGYEVALLDLVVDGQNHAVTLVDGDTIVDFTLSQFRSHLPFPYIAKLDSPEFHRVYEFDLKPRVAIKKHRTFPLSQHEADTILRKMSEDLERENPKPIDERVRYNDTDETSYPPLHDIERAMVDLRYNFGWSDEVIGALLKVYPAEVGYKLSDPVFVERYLKLLYPSSPWRVEALMNEKIEIQNADTDKLIEAIKKAYHEDTYIAGYKGYPPNLEPIHKKSRARATRRVANILANLPADYYSSRGRRPGRTVFTVLEALGLHKPQILNYIYSSSKSKKASKKNPIPPASVAREAREGLELRASVAPSKRGGTSVGLARAKQLSNRQNISDSTMKRMRSFFARHEVDKKASGFRKGEKNYPSKGLQAWKLWGGDAGKRWVKKS